MYRIMVVNFWNRMGEIRYIACISLNHTGWVDNPNDSMVFPYKTALDIVTSYNFKNSQELWEIVKVE